MNKSKLITGKEAFELLEDAVAYIIEDGNSALVYGSPDDNGEEGYEMELSYDDEGLTWEYYFSWEPEQEIKVENNQIFLEDKSREKQGEIGIKIIEVKEL